MGRFVGKLHFTRALLIGGGLIALLTYLFVFRSLSRETGRLDGELDQVWRDLTRESFVNVDGRLDAARQSDLALAKVESSVSRRIGMDAAFEKSLKGSFQLVEFEIERATRSDELLKLAGTRKVSIPAAPFGELPNYTEEFAEPRLLWGRLAIGYHALMTAIDAGVDTIENVGSFKVRKHGSPAPFLDEITFKMTLTGSMAKMSDFLKALPMGRSDLDRHGLTSTQRVKPALFIDGLMLRKRPGKNFDDVRLDLRIGGFIYRESSSLAAAAGEGKGDK